MKIFIIFLFGFLSNFFIQNRVFSKSLNFNLKTKDVHLIKLRKTKSFVSFQEELLHKETIEAYRKICRNELKLGLVPVNCHNLLNKLQKSRRLFKAQKQEILKKLDNFCIKIEEPKLASKFRANELGETFSRIKGKINTEDKNIKQKLSKNCLKKFLEALKIEKYKFFSGNEILFKILE